MKSLKGVSGALYKEMYEFMRDSNITKAREILQKLYSLQENDIEIINLLGLCNYKLCRFEDAKELWTKSIKIKPINNKAEEYLQTITTNEFKEITHLYTKGKQALQEGNYKESLYLLNIIIQIKDDLVEPYLIIALIQIELDEMKNAIININKAMSMDKGNLDGQRYLENINGIINKRKGKGQSKYLAITAGFIAVLLGTLIWQRNNSQILQDVEPIKEDNNIMVVGSDTISTPRIVGYTLLDKAMFEYRNHNSKISIEILEYLVNTDVDRDILLEGLYWCGKSYEDINNRELANEYYNQYLDKGNNSDCYYDDILYDLAIYYFEKEDTISKEYALRLRESCSDSIYNNSKIMRILE